MELTRRPVQIATTVALFTSTLLLWTVGSVGSFPLIIRRIRQYHHRTIQTFPTTPTIKQLQPQNKRNSLQNRYQQQRQQEQQSLQMSSSSYLSKQPLLNPAMKEAKYTDEIPLFVFVLTLCVLPIWAFTILPFTILYQVGKETVTSILSSPKTTIVDSGYVVDASTLVPREKRKYDLVVLGVTGLTGSLAARYLAQTYGLNKNNKVVKWAVAGRSETKIRQVLQRLATELQLPELVNDVDILVVDTSVPSTLPRLVEQTRVVATTAGPYALIGSSVIEFCAKFGTHYVDITGEITWIKTMMNLWQTTAQKTGAKIIPFCGHDSIPWDLSVMKMRDYLRSECNGDSLVQATFWDDQKGSAGAGTLATFISAVEGKQPDEPKQDPFVFPPEATTPSVAELKRNLPSLWNAIQEPNSPFFPPSTLTRTAPFIMADVNAEIVRWSHALLFPTMSKKNKNGDDANVLTYRETMLVPNFVSGFVMHVGLIIFFSLMLNPITLFLVKRFVLPTLNQASPIDVMENEHYLTVLGEGVGVDGTNKVQTVMHMDKNAGILGTSHMMIEAGLCLALQHNDLPRHHHDKEGGGFWSTAAGLGDVLLQRLTKHAGISFQARIVPKSNMSS